LFLKFNRFFSIRNIDVLSLYLLVPGFLFLMDAARHTDHGETYRQLTLYGYIWLMAGSLFLFIRCLLDLTLIGRPALLPNLNLSGLAWLSGAMFFCMVPIAARLPEELLKPVGQRSAAMDVLSKASSETVDQVQSLAGGDRNAALTRFWVSRTIAVLCHLAVVTALVLIGAVHFQNTTSGVAAATFYLLLPYTAFHIGQAHHVFPAALLIWAVYCYRRPSLAGLLLGLAAGSCFFPALTLPVWLSFYRRAGMGRFLLAFALAAGVSLGLTGLVLWVDGRLAQSLQLVLSLADWQPWQATDLESIWRGVHGAYRLPVFMLYLMFVVLTAFWPRPKNLAHVVALCAAVLIGIQFWHADRGGVYVLWYLPLMMLIVFRPNLTDRRPPPLAPLPTWPVNVARRVRDWALHAVQRPDPMAKV
ncbi:MAG: hypothetical protein ACJ8F7_18480, partial [Gemmataceae bacterium]